MLPPCRGDLPARRPAVQDPPVTRNRAGGRVVVEGVRETNSRAGALSLRQRMKTDAELIRQGRSDPDAIGELYRRHAEAIHGWFRVRTDARFAEDLTAETFAQAVLSLKRFRDEADGSAAPWLFGIARNLLRPPLERTRVETAARRRLGMPVRFDEPGLDAVDEQTS